MQHFLPKMLHLVFERALYNSPADKDLSSSDTGMQKMLQFRQKNGKFKHSVLCPYREVGIHSIKTFAIGGCLDAQMQQAIAGISGAPWKHYLDCALAETVHSIGETKKAFRLIVIKYKHQGELLRHRP